MPPGMKGSYVEPEYYEERIQQTVYRGFRSRRERTQFVRWICVPYFFVADDPQAGVSRSSTGPETPPKLRFFGSGYIFQGRFFQVAQLWVLMIGDGLLFTCARRSLQYLVGNTVNIKTLPPADPNNRASGDRAPVIIVSDGGIRTWLLPLQDCRTWPVSCFCLRNSRNRQLLTYVQEFSANFAELGVDLSDGWYLLYQNLKIDRKDWSKIVQIASKFSIRLTLERRYVVSREWLNLSGIDAGLTNDRLPDDDSSDSDSDLETVESRIPPVKQDPVISAASDSIDDDLAPIEPVWHVFTLLAATVAQSASDNQDAIKPAVEPPRVLNVDPKVLRDDADEIQEYLTSVNKRRGENAAYVNCPKSSIASVKEYVRGIAARPGLSAEYVSRQIHFYKAARNIFTFFYPFNFEHVVSAKYWGAVQRILGDDIPAGPTYFFLQRLRNFRSLAHLVQDLKEEVFSRRSPQEHHTNVPHEFIQAWMLCLMHLVLFTTEEAERTSNYVRRCRALLTRGKMNVIQRLQTSNLKEREAVSPLGLASLMIGQLLEDARGGPMFPDRNQLASLYWNDLQKLVGAVSSVVDWELTLNSDYSGTRRSSQSKIPRSFCLPQRRVRYYNRYPRGPATSLGGPRRQYQRIGKPLSSD
jgi:hypothetical protein